MSFIYKITNTITGKIYIGKTDKTITHRFAKHKYNTKCVDTYLYRSITKYGLENFVIEQIEEVSPHLLNEREQYWIAYYNSMIPNGYNMTQGGDGGDTSNSPKYREALARRDVSGPNNPMFGKRGENSPNYGKKRTQEQKENHRKGYKGKRIRVKVDGIEYESVALAAKTLGRSERYIRLHDELNEWTY